MSLLVLRFGRAAARPDGNAPEMLDACFAHVARHHACVLPGEPLDPERLNVCLMFDGAYFDFYRFVFALLVKHQLRVVLGVPAEQCPDFTSHSETERLLLLDRFDFPHRPPASFCSWDELRDLARSGCVEFAVQGGENVAVNGAELGLEREIEEPQRLFKRRLGLTPKSFVFPYGHATTRASAKVREHYRYAFRLGGGLNRDWNGTTIDRVNADNMSAPEALFSPERLRGYRWRGWWNRLRWR